MNLKSYLTTAKVNRHIILLMLVGKAPIHHFITTLLVVTPQVNPPWILTMVIPTLYTPPPTTEILLHNSTCHHVIQLDKNWTHIQ
jgi:hypothetical protein